MHCFNLININVMNHQNLSQISFTLLKKLPCSEKSRQDAFKPIITVKKTTTKVIKQHLVKNITTNQFSGRILPLPGAFFSPGAPGRILVGPFLNTMFDYIHKTSFRYYFMTKIILYLTGSNSRNVSFWVLFLHESIGKI